MDAVCFFYENVSDWENFEICRERLFGVLEREKLTESDIYANGEEPGMKLSSLHSDKDDILRSACLHTLPHK